MNILIIKNIAKHPFDNKQGCLIQYLYNLVQLDLVLMWIWMKSETTTFELDLVEQPVFYTYQNLINWQDIKFSDILQKLFNWQKNNDIESQKDMNLMLTIFHWSLTDLWNVKIIGYQRLGVNFHIKSDSFVCPTIGCGIFPLLF